MCQYNDCNLNCKLKGCNFVVFLNRKSVVLKVLTNKYRCKHDVALYNCCNIEYNHGKVFIMVAKAMKNWELQSL